jgi:hypothetical protein
MISLTSKAHLRQRVIRYSAKHGVTEASLRHRVSRQAIYEWLARYDGKSWKSLTDSLEQTARSGLHAAIQKHVACNQEDAIAGRG